MKLYQAKRSRGGRLPRGIWLKSAVIVVAAQLFVALLQTFTVGGEANAQVAILYLVTTTDDHDDGFCDPATVGDCTLREAINQANAHSGVDGIRFSVDGIINLVNPLPVISDDVSINGPGAASLSVSGGGGSIFNVTATGTVSISSLTISNGATSSTGGAVNNASTGTVNITNCILNGNSASQGGAIYNAGTLNVTSCTLSSNTADYGGGIYNSNPGTANVTNCVISGNSELSTICCFGGGGIFNNGILNVTNCTLSSNTALHDGGGIWSSGTLSVTSCTLSSNTADTGGGIYSSGDTGGVTDLTNSTITGNSAVVSGGIVSGGLGGTFNVKSSIIALNTAASRTNPQDAYRTFVSQGFNLIGKIDGSNGFTAATDLTGTAASPLDPGLDPSGLQNNGGAIALLCGSPAIDKGSSNGLTGTLTKDQRGSPRTVDDSLTPNATGGDGTDIGAFELNTVSCPMPLPESQLVFTPAPASLPVLNADPAVAKPMGLGSVATGGGTLNIQIGTVGFSGPAEVYFAVFSPQALGNDIFLYTGGTFVAFSQTGLVPWIASTNGSLNEDLFGAIPLSALPSGAYTLYFAVAPAGSSLATFYFWSTEFMVP